MFDPNLIARDDSGELERRLRSWQPSLGGLDRDRMLFDAGRAAARAARPPLLRARWPLVSAAAALLACALGVAWNAERAGRRELEIALGEASQRQNDRNEGARDEVASARIGEPDTAHDHRPLDSSSYLVLVRQLVPTHGETGQPRNEVPLEARRLRPVLPPREPSPLGVRDLKRVIPL
jgi:hypothetical protein